MSYLSRLGVAALGTTALLSLNAGCDTPGSGTLDMAPRDLAGAQTPTLFSVTPASAAATGGAKVTIVGTNFDQGATVKIGGVAATNVQYQSSLQLVVTVPAYTGALGPVEVTVQNPSSLKVSRSDVFSYVRVPVTFAATVTRASGHQPTSIVADDVNGDGGRELILTNSGDSTITVLLNNQNFMSLGTYPTATNPISLAVADLNGDGVKDVVVGCSNSDGHDVDVLRGNGNGAFLAPVHSTVGMNVTGVAVQDFNSDGKVDVAALVRTGGGLLYVMTNNSVNPNVSFTTPYVSYSAGAGPVSLLLADLNKDGKGDLVTASYSGNLLTSLLWTISGAFVPATKTAAVGANPVSLASGDLNGDGSADVVAANFQDATLSMLKGQGDGTFANAVSLTATDKPSAVAIGDIDGDGKQDIVMASSGRNQIWVLLGKGDGTFEPAQPFIVGQQPWALTVADLDRDGKPDVATANLASGDVSILYNRTQN